MFLRHVAAAIVVTLLAGIDISTAGCGGRTDRSQQSHVVRAACFDSGLYSIRVEALLASAIGAIQTRPLLPRTERLR